MTRQPSVSSIYLYVANVSTTAKFYRDMGFEVEEVANFGRVLTPDGLGLEFGTAALTRGYDPGHEPPSGPSRATVNFALESRAAVDELYSAMVERGYTGHLAPIDAFWGARFAILRDPDGNDVGLQSPRDNTMLSRPPA